jgi:hypothetical protein
LNIISDCKAELARQAGVTGIGFAARIFAIYAASVSITSSRSILQGSKEIMSVSQGTDAPYRS